MESAAVCTLFEGHYHHGLGALVNSLYQHGFRGICWAGYRGPLPPWASNLSSRANYDEYAVADGCVIRFVRLQPDVHFANYKPAFMLQILEQNPAVDGLCYFDPDIVIRCRWSFFEEWIECGIALVQEVTNGTMPSNHPIRMKWVFFASALGYALRNSLNQYFNSGFAGIQRRDLSFLNMWNELLSRVGKLDLDMQGFMPGDRTHPFFGIDQDTMNLATMLTDAPLSTIGPEGMDFVPGGFTMSHAVGGPKPWKKNFLLEAIGGRRPSAADKAFWENISGPIVLFPAWQSRLRKAKMNAATLLTRFYRK